MTKAQLGAIGDDGQPVDWWFMYKVSGMAKSTSSVKATGTEYLYADANSTKAGKSLVLSPNHVDKPQGALFSTLNQLYAAAAKANQHLGWFFYNDQFPPGKSVGSRGHTKGVLAFDLATDSAFWLIQSTPNFPPPVAYAFPPTGHREAQTLLCVTLKDAVISKQIAGIMHVAHQPNVYAHSAVPVDLANTPGDCRVLLIQDNIAANPGPVAVDVPIASRAGGHFRCMAKNKQWDQDFYNDLVGPALHDDLEVETWLHHATPSLVESDKIHKIEVMQGVDLAPIKLPFSWSDDFDHAKLAISHPDEKTPWVCVGDINFTTSMRNRGGGTLAFQNADLWTNLDEILSDRAAPAAPAPRRTAQVKKAPAEKTPERRAAPKKAPAKKKPKS